MTALKNETVRKQLTGGKNVTPNQLQIQALFDDEGVEIIGREIGFFLDDGTLFAIDSHPINIITYKSASNGSKVLETFDLILDSVPPNTVTVSVFGDMTLHEEKSNPHSQYEMANNSASNNDIDEERATARHIKLPEYWAGINKKINAQVMLLQFAPYNPLRTYRTGETCTIEVAGEVIAMQMYAGPNLTCLNKDPADLANRHEAWADPSKPFWWIPYTGTEVGTPFWWLDTTPAESSVMEINADLPIAVYWRLARRYPALVVGDIINTGEIRGEFLRVLDQGRGVDTGRVINSAQGDLLESHTHLSMWFGTPSFGYWDPTSSSTSSGIYKDNETTATGGEETRPRNIARAMAITI
jgi:hypothetical protein